jgi:hypothetical protein
MSESSKFMHYFYLKFRSSLDTQMVYVQRDHRPQRAATEATQDKWVAMFLLITTEK